MTLGGRTSGAPCPLGITPSPERSSIRGEPALITDLWYKNAIVYCLSVKTFMDSDGDGIGDFQEIGRAHV